MGETDEQTPLPVDPEITVAKLANGLDCWIRPHRGPYGGVVLGLRVGAGALHEEESERGLSHMLEHLAFEGGARFPRGELQRFFDSLGTRLGRHHNAYTGRESTCYTLSLPGGDERTVDSGLACLADFAYGMSLEPAAVEEERRVIVEEMRQYDDAETRLRQKILALLLPGSRVADRHPLGTEEAVRSVTVGELRSYYVRWYRPDNSTLLIAGDVDPVAVERLLRRHFSDWTPAADKPHPPAAGIRPVESPRVAVVSDPELDKAMLRLLWLRPAASPRTAGELRSQWVGEMAVWLVHQRLGAVIREGHPALREAGFVRSPLVSGWAVARAAASGPPARFAALVAALARELKRVRDHGFSAAEAERAAARLVNTGRQAARGAARRSADSLLTEMNDAVPTGRPPMSPAQRLALAEALLPTVAAAAPGAAFAASFPPAQRLAVAVLSERRGRRLPAPEELRRLLARADASPVAAPAVRTPPRRLMERAPAPGEVAAQWEEPELDLLSLELANGVRVHLCPMRSVKDRVHLALTLAGGRIREGAGNLGVTGAAALAFAQPATVSLPSTVIRDLMVDKAVGLRCSVDEDAVTLRVAGDPRDFEHALQLLHLLLTRPRLEAAALERWQCQIAERREPPPEARLALEALRLLTGDDPRFRLISGARAGAITLGEAERWLRHELCRAPLEAAVVGDLDRGRALELACVYLGSLPPRPLADPGLDELRELAPFRGPLESALEAATVTPRAAVLNAWQAAPWRAAPERRLLRLAAQILGQRLYQGLRKHRGMTYSTDCSYSPSKAYPRASLLSIAFYASPQRLAEAAAASREIVAELAATGPTEAEVAGVCRRFHDVAARAGRDPRFWCRVLADHAYRGLRPADLKPRPQGFLSLRREDVRAVLERFVVEERRLAVTCLPAERSL